MEYGLLAFRQFPLADDGLNVLNRIRCCESQAATADSGRNATCDPYRVLEATGLVEPLESELNGTRRIGLLGNVDARDTRARLSNSSRSEYEVRRNVHGANRHVDYSEAADGRDGARFTTSSNMTLYDIDDDLLIAGRSIVGRLLLSSHMAVRYVGR